MLSSSACELSFPQVMYPSLRVSTKAGQLQFTSEAYTSVLLYRGVRVSMDSAGAYMDNVFVERLWRSVKYEEVYLKPYESVAEAREGIGAYLSFYNTERPHKALEYRTPAQVFEEGTSRTHQSELNIAPQLVPA